MPNLKFIRTIKSKFDAVPIVDGQLIFTSDLYGIYVDFGSERKEYKQIITLTSAEREALLTPVVGFYFEVDTGHLFYYNNNWMDISSADPNSMVVTYDSSEELLEISSGETLSVAFGKIKTAIGNLISHLKDFSNPHKVTKDQIGLGTLKTNQVQRYLMI